MLKQERTFSIVYEMGVVSKRFDHGGHDGIPVDTETKETQGHFSFRNVVTVF